MRLLLLVTAVLTAWTQTPIWAQSTEDWKTLQAQYPADNGVFLDYSIHVTIQYDKENKPFAVIEHVEDRQFFNQNAMQYAEDNVWYSYHNTIEDLDTYTLVPGEKKYEKIKVTEFDTLNNFSASIFYDDVKKIRFYYKGLQPGAKTILRYTETEQDIHFVGMDYLGSYLPILKGKLVIDYPAGMELNYQEYNLDQYDFKFTKRESKKGNTLTWTYQNIPSKKPVGRAVSFSYVMPVVAYQVKSYTVKGETSEVFPSLDHLYAWYYSNIEKSVADDNDTLRLLVDSITAPYTEDLDKAKAIYYWVQDNIRYVAFENGEGGIVPRPSGLVFDRRFGDCKDMSCLTHRMFRYAGLEAHLGWLGTRDIPFKYTETPSPLVDNHMICVFDYGDSTYFLDATAHPIPFGVPPEHIQGKQVLTEYGKDKYIVHTVPELPYDFTGKVDSCELRIEGSSLIGDCECTYTGFRANTVRRNYNNIRADKKEKYIRDILEKGSNKFSLTDYKISGHEDRDQPMVVTYSFKLDDYIQNYEDEYYVNLNLIKRLKSGEIDTTVFIYDFDGDFRFYDREVNRLTLPEGYELNYTPENTQLEAEEYGYEMTYSQNESNQLQLIRTVYVDYTRFPTENFADWNLMVKTLNKAYNKTLVLKKNTAKP
ncbi:transglutaminase domain-containing protein [bacterium SCSIO 12741]|nr:transglutaminase domain-containing protein [bacterium SCSIO 12741]